MGEAVWRGALVFAHAFWSALILGLRAGMAWPERPPARVLARRAWIALSDLSLWNSWFFAGLTRPVAGLARARGDLVLWLPVFVGLGAGLYLLLPREPVFRDYLTLLPLSLPLLALIRPRRNLDTDGEAVQFLAYGLLFAMLGFAILGGRAQMLKAPVLDFRYYGPIEGRVVGIDRSGSDRLRLTLDQLRLDRVAPHKLPQKVTVSLSEAVVIEPGQRVMTTGSLMPPNGPVAPQAYDFRRKFWFDQIGALGYTRAPVLLAAAEQAQSASLLAHKARMDLSRAMQARIGQGAYDGQGAAIAAAVMVGDRSAITARTNEVMRSSNLFHIISISGLHMGMLAGFIFGALRMGLALIPAVALRVNTKKLAALTALLACAIYNWLAGSNVATERSFLMVAVMLLAVLFDRRALSLNTVALAALLLLLLRPEVVADAGFQMSFGATIGLIVMSGPWAPVQALLPPLLRPAALLIATSVIAGLVTGPIAAAHFNRMAEYGVLANLLVVPVMGVVVMPAGVLAGLLAPLGLAGPLFWLMGLGCDWMIFVAEFVTWLGGAAQAVPSPAPWVLPMIIGAGLLLVLGRGAGRGLGVLALCGAFWGWGAGARPALLVASEAQQVGLMTPQGRALSKSGAAFVAQAWLGSDGDVVSVKEAYARAGWRGPRGAREAEFGGRVLWHLSGKDALDKLKEVCRDGAIVVISERVEGEAGGCLLLDLRALARLGAVELRARGAAVEVVSALALEGDRLWTR